jgi:ubiquinone/menaquinone biosynthesis C-methylase UbiE
MAFTSEHPDFITPPAFLSYDAYHHTNWWAYYDTGLKHSELISDLIKEYLEEKEIKICEWGCGPARIIRHLDNIDGFNKIELYGTDYNEESISWCKKNIKGVTFLENTLDPPLPLESDLFDCVYAISIFTHLSEKSHYAWIEELFRILKPGGILIFTTHSDRCSSRLLPTEKEKYNAGRLVVKGRIREGKKHYLAYHPPQFIRKKLLRDHTILKHINNTDTYQLEQDVWCIEK